VLSGLEAMRLICTGSNAKQVAKFKCFLVSLCICLSSARRLLQLGPGTLIGGLIEKAIEMDQCMVAVMETK